METQDSKAVGLQKDHNSTTELRDTEIDQMLSKGCKQNWLQEDLKRIDEWATDPGPGAGQQHRAESAKWVRSQ